MTAVFRPYATALITGGGSGIGFAVAQLCRSHGMNLILVDIHAENLAYAHTILGDTPTAKTLTHVMDVGDLASWEYLSRKVGETFPNGVDLLMLNAGASFKPRSPETPWGDPEYFQKTFSTNIMGVVNGLSVFIPVVTASADEPRAIIITGSKQGITNPPGKNPAYNASKSAVKSLAEHLSHDLLPNKNVSTHLLVPGWTYTSMTGNTGVEPDAKRPKGAWLPEQVAGYLYDKMGEGEFYIICPDDEVSESLDRARIAWAMGDIIERRPALSRWNSMWKDVAAKWIERDAEVKRKS
ncbi:short chain dehydrogenase/reductase [Histoplasma capsulatum H143]|uniref:Short chain dehydrogenase/reductase n=1 Tax=Ajellomyces capsulatus (strain H143) TaxID=544712 RepID=C6H9F4_AJECH|nr:short chain dehydrogenase/reductase [Histoplasma capsulatum H143]